MIIRNLNDENIIIRNRLIFTYPPRAIASSTKPIFPKYDETLKPTNHAHENASHKNTHNDENIIIGTDVNGYLFDLFKI